MHRKRVSSVLGLALIAAIVAGCTTTPEPGVTSRFGKVQTRVNAQPEQVVEAANQVLEDMEMFVISSNASRLNGQVVARSSTDERITVDVENVGGDSSGVAVRAGGYFGGEGLRLSILRRIRQQLGEQGPG